MLTVLSIIAIGVAVMFPLYFLLRKDTITPPLPLSIAIVLAAVLELFDLLMLSNPEQLYYWKKFSLIAEGAMLPIWLWFSLTYARQNRLRTISTPLLFLLAASPLFSIFALILPINSFVYSPDLATEKVLFLSNYGFIFYLLLLVYLIATLIQLEQTLAHTKFSSRWRIKFELLGAGAFLSILIIYYSQALFFRTIDMGLMPMRSFVLIASIVMMFYSRLKRESGTVSVHISQRFACKSAVLFAVSIYIIFLGLVGEGMKYFGSGFQRALIFTLLFFAGLGLCIVLLSETAKRRVKVFIHKNFYRNKYDYQTEWLKFTDRLSSAKTGENLLNAIVSEFCDTFGMGAGALFTINQERDLYQQSAVVALGREHITFGVEDTVIAAMSNGEWIVDVQNDVTAYKDERHRLFFSEADAHYIVPLFMNEAVDGFIVLGRPHNAEEVYTFEDLDLMRTLAKQAASALLNLRLSDQLICTREMAAIGTVSTFVMHDLKNLVSTISLLLENAQEHITSPDFQNDLLMSLGNTVIKMRTIISRLKNLPEKNSLQLAPVDLLQMAHETAAMVTGRSLEVTRTTVIAEADREELQKVTLNLMLNAVEATEGDTPVKVEVGENGSPYIRVKDEGCGIAAAFIQHVLFKPFTSTKKQGMGIGLYQSRQIIEAHGGRIEVESRIDHGSEFTVWLPKIETVAI